MIYSVYNTETRAYDYYEGPGPKGTHAGAPPISGGNQIGATVTQAAWKVPPGAHKVGTGELPKGRVASIASLGSLGDAIGIDGKKLAMIGVAAYLAWRFLR